jgi:hypothetical protein
LLLAVELRRALPAVEVRKALPAVPRTLPTTAPGSTASNAEGGRSECPTGRSSRLLTRASCQTALRSPPEGVSSAKSVKWQYVLDLDDAGRGEFPFVGGSVKFVAQLNGSERNASSFPLASASKTSSP